MSTAPAQRAPARASEDAAFSSVATIDLGAFAHNVREALRLANGREVIAVVKADGYGHGALRVARAALAAGVRQLAVVTLAEAAELREADVAAPILVLGGVRTDAEAANAVDLGLTTVLCDEPGLRRLSAAAAGRDVRALAHVEVDTGMRRMGVSPPGALALLEAVERDPQVELEGAFTHLACADDSDLTSARGQLEQFRTILGEARARGLAPAMIHAVNSAGLMAAGYLEACLPEATAVRPGLMLYGVLPAPHLAAAATLRPVMTWSARVVRVETVDAGQSVGYGETWRAPETTRVATLPVGYADGVPWTAANAGVVWLAGARRPIVGRVSMDSITIDVGGAAEPVAFGDVATLFGSVDGVAHADGVPVEAAAQRAGTLSYELLTRVGARVPRVEVGG